MPSENNSVKNNDEINQNNDEAPKAEGEPSSPTPLPKCQKRKYDPSRALLIILLAVAFFVGLFYIYPYFSSLFGTQNKVMISVDHLDQVYASLETKFKELEKQLDAHKKQEALLEKEYLDRISQRLEDLEKRHVALDPKVLGSLQKQEKQVVVNLQELLTRVQQLEQLSLDRQKQIARIPEVIHSFTILRDEIQTTKPFEPEMKTIHTFLDPNDVKVQETAQIFSAIAKEGIPSYVQLLDSFKDVARDIRRSTISEEDPWYSRFFQRLRALVVVKKDGTALLGGTAVDDTLSSIKRHLEEKDADDALLEANHFTSADSETFRNWRKALETRVYVEKHLPFLESSALAYALRKNPNYDSPLHNFRRLPK